MDLQLSDRTIIVTAAAGGIGRAITQALIAEGATVVAADRQMSEASGETPTDRSPGAMMPIELDLLDPSASEQLVAEALASTGRLDAIVAVLGGPNPTNRTFTERSDSDWQDAFELNLLSGVRLVRAAVPALRAIPEASFVFVGSDLARQPDPAFVEYAAMKSALLSLSKSLSKEFGPVIRSNVISPGPTRTPGLEREFAEHVGPARGISGEEAIQQYVREARRMPSGRLALPAEIARAAAFLVSPASAPMTGAELVIDGGTRVAS
jgi:NAD(P)-dependent dehydrogenase (short-subunit alcohol dehydrogenase family)